MNESQTVKTLCGMCDHGCGIDVTAKACLPNSIKGSATHPFNMGFGEYFPWKNCEEGINHLFSKLGMTYQDLVAKGGIHHYEERRYKKHETEGFNTPSGKVEIYAQRLKDVGMESSPIRKDIFKIRSKSDEFPLILSTGGNLIGYTHWQYRYIPKLRKISPDPLFEIHPDTARHFGLAHGEMAVAKTRYGKIKIKVYTTQTIRPDTVHVPQGREEANANKLTGSEDFDPISGFPNLKSERCKIQKG